MILLLKNLDIFFNSKSELNSTIIKSQIVFFISSIFELTGILMLGPLIFLATSGLSSLENEQINFLFHLFNFQNFQNFFIFFFLCTFMLIFLGALSAIFSVILLSRISTDCGVTLGNKLLNHYIYQRWSFLMSTSSNKMINEIYQESSRVTQNIFVPMMMLNKNLMLSFFIICGLLYVDVVLTSAFFLVLSLVYIFIYLVFRSRLYRNSELLTEAHENRLSFLNDVFELMKQIKVWGNESYFIKGFGKASEIWGNSYKHNLNVALLPRYFVESFILLGITALIFYSATSGTNFSESFPKLSVFLFSAFKLLPALQGIYYSSSQVRGNIFSLENIIKNFNSNPPPVSTNKDVSKNSIEKIEFKNISFNYPNAENFAIKNVSLSFERNKIIGITGKSGSGKSTFCDVLMGLLKQSKGSIEINGKQVTIYENTGWFEKISYAPPQARLIADSVENNIFFASKNYHPIEFIKKIVNLDFLSSNKDLTSPTSNNLSAGQIQRLGLARAMARITPELIILDEPTSALDNANKSHFLKNLKNLKHDKIIILITHEIDILEELDQILIFQDGVVESYDSFSEASKKSSELNLLIDPQKN